MRRRAPRAARRDIVSSSNAGGAGARAATRACAVESLEGRTLLASVPTGFADSVYVSGLGTNSPTAMTFAPGGRLFVARQSGSLRLAKDGQLLATPFLTLNVDSWSERGLIGVAVDPNFVENGHVYVHYTVPQTTRFNRVSRFTAVDADPDPDRYVPGDTAEPGSEHVLTDLDPLSAGNHNGGALHFGSDGKLYVSVGDNANGANAQTLTNRHGKVLRLNPDGSIPTDNPFYDTATGDNRQIWALGLRNPYTFAVQPGTGRMFVNDVGSGGTSWQREEVNEGGPGRNFGWPTTEGSFDPARYPQFTNPVYFYNPHDPATDGNAITGGAFYNPPAANFPAEYVGDYFFADYGGGWIRRLEPGGATATASLFATGIGAPVDLDVGPDGALYYLARASGAVGRIAYTASAAPSISQHPADRTVAEGAPAEFTVAASGDGPLTYRWQRADGAGGAFADVAGATGSTYRIEATALADDGARFRAVVSNGAGSATSDEALLTVQANRAPVAVIDGPAAGSTYAAGDAVTYSGAGTDPEDGSLAPAAMTWRIDFHHADHTHPFMQETAGAAGGSFEVPRVGETDADQWYRIYLTVTDSRGLTHTTFRDVAPKTASVTVATEPAGLQFELDGQPRTAPLTFVGVVGMTSGLEAPATQSVNGVTYEFVAWSDGGARGHDIETPAADATYTAAYRVVPPPAEVVARRVFYNNSAFDGRYGGADERDAAAVATDKRVGLPGEALTFANLTSYSRGVNGVVVDVRGLPPGEGPLREDVSVRVGAGAEVAQWVTAKSRPLVDVRRGGGEDGSDRVTLIWPDYSLRNTWVEVTVAANERTGLASPDVFYAGNLVGETGDLASSRVGALDLAATRAARRSDATSAENRFDFNRDKRVNVADLLAVRRNLNKSVAAVVAPAAPAATAARAYDLSTPGELLT